MHFSVKLQVFKQLEIQTLFMDQANGFSQAEQPLFFFFWLGLGSGGSYSARLHCRHRSEGEQSQHQLEKWRPRGLLTMTCIFEGWYESIQSLGRTPRLGLVLSANVNYVITESAEAITNVTFTVHCRPEKRVFHTVVVLLEQDYTNRRWLPCQMQPRRTAVWGLQEV